MQPVLSQDESHGPNSRVQFREPLSNTFIDDVYAEVQADTNKTSDTSTYVTAFDDPSPSNYPILPPVLEEPSSSFSEGNDS